MGEKSKKKELSLEDHKKVVTSLINKNNRYISNAEKESVSIVITAVNRENADKVLEIDKLTKSLEETRDMCRELQQSKTYVVEELESSKHSSDLLLEENSEFVDKITLLKQEIRNKSAIIVIKTNQYDNMLIDFNKLLNSNDKLKSKLKITHIINVLALIGVVIYTVILISK